jgi:hypothetical protein
MLPSPALYMGSPGQSRPLQGNVCASPWRACKPELYSHEGTHRAI